MRNRKREQTPPAQTGAYQDQIRSLFKRMRRKRILLFFTRNRIRNRVELQQRLITVFGLSIWKTLPSLIRTEWNDAAGSFDKMLGLLAAWKERTDPDWARLLETEKTEGSRNSEETEKALSMLRGEVSGLINQINAVLSDSDKEVTKTLEKQNAFADADKDVRALKIRLAALAIEKAQRQAKEKS